ncbi:hypothetical protein [Kitasatospora sp. NPDC085879]|uniref:hypothetical protein n=1 Tax=Kitasatospora sp. NPDC085879 TaxID=3154769 RepID=UPI00342BD583
MLPALIALTVLLAIATATNLLLTFALVRRMRAIEATGLRTPRRPPAGTPVADFTVRSVGGRTIGRGDLLGGDRLVGFLQVGCGPCAELIADVTRLVATPVLPAYFFVSGDPSDPRTREMAAQLAAIGEAALVGDGLEVATAFGGVEAFPTLLVLRDAVVTASGHDLAGVLPHEGVLPLGSEHVPSGAVGGLR